MKTYEPLYRNTVASDPPHMKVMELLLWWEMRVEISDDLWPTHAPLSEADWADDDEYEAALEAANQAKRDGYIDAYDPADGARLTAKGVEHATALFPDARERFGAAEQATGDSP